MQDRSVAAIWISGFITLIAAIFLISGCVAKDSVLNAQLQSKCIAAGGNWDIVRGSSTTFACVMR